jgi:hypothetical protein
LIHGEDGEAFGDDGFAVFAGSMDDREDDTPVCSEFEVVAIEFSGCDVKGPVTSGRVDVSAVQSVGSLDRIGELLGSFVVTFGFTDALKSSLATLTSA